MAWYWNDIFEGNSKKKPQHCKDNGCIYEVKEERCIYQEVKENSYATLDACVEHAIKTGNHTAFVHFFYEKAKEKKQKKIFSDVFWEYMGEYEQRLRKNKKLSKWEKFQIIKPSYWRSFIFDYREENKNEKEYYYSKDMLQKWNSSAGGIPEKDAIVQCCFYFGKNVEETNRLLMAGGCEKLYILDVVDVVSMYYLNKYSGNFEISAFEKLKEVKEKINVVLERCYKERKDMVAVRGFKKTKLLQHELTEEEKELLQVLKAKWDGKTVSFGILDSEKELSEAKNMLEKQYEIKYFITWPKEKKKDKDCYKNIKITHKDCGGYLKWNSKTKTLFRFEKKLVLKLGRKLPIGWDIEKEIEQYCEILKKRNESKNGDSTDLTPLDIEKFFEQTMDMDKFIESGTIGDSEEWMFAQKRYGYFLKTFQYIRECAYYIKNLQYSSCKVNSKDRPISIEDLSKRGKFLDKNKKIEKFVAKIKEEIKEKEEQEEVNQILLTILKEIWKIKEQEEKVNQILITILDKVWCISNAIEENMVDKRSDGQCKIKYLIEGRNIVLGEGYKIEDKNDLKEAYKMDLTDKKQLMKFAIATGREDEIGEYLKISGYWEEELDKVENVEKKELVDRTDCLILYALKYRDALLKKWANSLGVDELEYHKKATKEFPFIKLLMTINREIQLANEKCLEESEKESKQELEKDLIYKLVTD